MGIERKRIVPFVRKLLNASNLEAAARDRPLRVESTHWWPDPTRRSLIGQNRGLTF